MANAPGIIVGSDPFQLYGGWGGVMTGASIDVGSCRWRLRKQTLGSRIKRTVSLWCEAYHMIKRVILFVAAVAVLAVGYLAVFGQPGAADHVFERYRKALIDRDFIAAAALANDDLRAFDLQAVQLARRAAPDELLSHSDVHVMSVLSLRRAVLSERIALAELRVADAPEAAHALMRSAMASTDQFNDVGVVFALPVSATRTLAWLGPRAYVGDWTIIPLVVSLGARIDITRATRGDPWRLNYLPAVRASAGEHAHLGIVAPAHAAPESRRAAFEALLSGNGAALPPAIWQPLDAD